MVKVLLIEDDKDMQELLTHFLSRYHISVIGAFTRAEAFALIAKEYFDIIVLDLMLPDGDGIEVCQYLSSLQSKIPIIISSAKGDLGSKIVGFELGADDYLAKPYEPRELVLRIEALMRRTQRHLLLECGALTIDEEKRIVYYNKNSLELTRTEYDLLLFFINNIDKPLSRHELAWHLHCDENSRSIDTHVSNLRLKLGDNAKEPQFIKNIWGIGYKFLQQP